MNIKYKQNMGILDRMLRFYAGTILIVSGIFLLTNTIGIVLSLLSFPLLVSGITGFCPVYIFMGISTKRKNNSDKNGIK